MTERKRIESICVFCGSSSGNSEIYTQEAEKLGKLFAKNKIKLVYGGSNVGLMGVVADSVLKNGGEVIGVLPRFLSDKEIAHLALTELILVDTMHQRKNTMAELSDAFIALPGGFGTLEELFEVTTWHQLGLHSKPIGILNLNGFYDSLFSLIENMASNGFLKEETKGIILVSEAQDKLLEKLQNYKRTISEKWFDESKT